MHATLLDQTLKKKHYLLDMYILCTTKRLRSRATLNYLFFF